MGPKNAIKIINIQNSYSVHIGFIRSYLAILSTKVQFGPFGIIQFISVKFGLHWPYSVRFGPFDPN